MKKILLTGASGFIGRNIKESYLSEVYELFAPSSSELDLKDEKSVKEYFRNKEFDTVIHCACKPGHRNAPDRNALCETNVRMFENLVQCKDSYDKFLNFGSGAIYNISNDIISASEQDCAKSFCTDEHGKCKEIVYSKIKELTDFIDLRLFGIFGRYEDYAIRFISNAICKTLFDLPVTLRQNRRFSYLYIDDLMPVLEYFIENDMQYDSYNIVPDETNELLSLGKKIIELSGKELDFLIAKDGYSSEYTGDNTRLKREYVNVKFTSMYNAAERLYDWYASRKAELDINLLLTDK